MSNQMYAYQLGRANVAPEIASVFNNGELILEPSEVQGNVELNDASNGVVLYENSANTFALHKWNNNGAHPNAEGNKVRYHACVGGGCNAKRQLITVGKYTYPKYIGKHTDAPVVEKKVAAQYAELHTTTLAPPKAHNSFLRSGKIISKKDMYNSLQYQKSKLLNKDRISTFLNHPELINLQLKPFSCVLANLGVDLKPVSYIMTDTTYGLIEEKLHLSTVNTMDHGQVIPLGHSIHTGDTAEDYVVFFGGLKNTGLDPAKAFADFDLGIRNALRQVWPEIKIVGDLLHFYANNFKNNKLKRFNIDPAVLSQELTKLVESKDWETFHVNYENFKKEFAAFPDYLQYFHNSWIVRNPKELWCKANGEEFITSSPLESWHHYLKETIFDGKKNVRVDASVLLLEDNFDLTTIKGGEALKVTLKDSRSTTKDRVSGLTGLIPKQDKKDPKILYKGRLVDPPPNFYEIRKSILREVPARFSYPYSQTGRLLDREVSDLKWTENQPYSFSGLDSGFRKNWTTSKVRCFDEQFYQLNMMKKLELEQQRIYDEATPESDAGEEFRQKDLEFRADFHPLELKELEEFRQAMLAQKISLESLITKKADPWMNQTEKNIMKEKKAIQKEIERNEKIEEKEIREHLEKKKWEGVCERRKLCEEAARKRVVSELSFLEELTDDQLAAILDVKDDLIITNVPSDPVASITPSNADDNVVTSDPKASITPSNTDDSVIDSVVHPEYEATVTPSSTDDTVDPEYEGVFSSSDTEVGESASEDGPFEAKVSPNKRSLSADFSPANKKRKPIPLNWSDYDC